MRSVRVSIVALVLAGSALAVAGMAATGAAEDITTGSEAFERELAADAGEPSAKSAAAPEPLEGGATIVDTEGSARREAEFHTRPSLPAVFVHQWRYREPLLPLPDSRRVEPGVARLSLGQAVHTALEHNPGIAAQRLTPLRDREDVRRAEAIFDPRFTLFLDKEHAKAPNASGLTGVRENIQDNKNANVSLDKQLRSGADFRIDFTNNRLRSNAQFQSLVPQYQPELLFSLNQPVLRNFGLNFAYLLVEVAGINSESAKYTYRAQLADFVKRVIEAYWAVVFARDNLAVQEQSLELARQTLRENEERVRVGLLAPVAVKEAESEAASREQQVIVANNLLDNTRRTLRQIVYLQAGDAFVPKAIEPVEEPRTAPVAVDGDQALATALDRRPEITAQNLDLRSKNLTARVRENQLLPRLDFVGNFGLNGLSGDPREVTLTTGQTATSPFPGDYGRSLERLGSGSFYSYQAGVELEIPLGNAAAKADYTQAKIDVSQAELNRRQLLSDISLEVSKAVTDVVANMKRIQAARVARELAEENLRNQQKRLEVGIATTKDVLDFQDDLTRARGVEVLAATDYNISLAELARSQGTLLDQYSVVVEVPGERFTPWWAKF